MTKLMPKFEQHRTDFAYCKQLLKGLLAHSTPPSRKITTRTRLEYLRRLCFLSNSRRPR